MKDLLTEIVNKLYEEQGIAEIVTKETNKIIAAIIKNSKTIPYSTRKTNTFEYTFNDNIIYVTYNLFYLQDNTQLNNILNYTGTRTGYSGKMKDNEYYLNTAIAYVRNQNIYHDIEGTTQHEFNHIYNMIMSGNDLQTKPETKKLYSKARQLTGHNDVNYQMIGYVIYYNNKFEESGFVNSIYKKMMNNPNKDPRIILQNFPVYKNVLFIKEHIIDRKQEYQSILEPIIKQEFNKSYNWFYTMTCNVVDSYIKKMGKVLYKAEKDLNIKRLDDIPHELLTQPN